jgi:hypothetical protein
VPKRQREVIEDGYGDRIVKERFFRDPVEFRKWLEPNYARVEELWVGYYKKSTGRPSLTWPESWSSQERQGRVEVLRSPASLL